MTIVMAHSKLGSSLLLFSNIKNIVTQAIYLSNPLHENYNSFIKILELNYNSFGK